MINSLIAIVIGLVAMGVGAWVLSPRLRRHVEAPKHRLHKDSQLHYGWTPPAPDKWDHFA